VLRSISIAVNPDASNESRPLPQGVPRGKVKPNSEIPEPPYPTRGARKEQGAGGGGNPPLREHHPRRAAAKSRGPRAEQAATKTCREGCKKCVHGRSKEDLDRACRRRSRRGGTNVGFSRGKRISGGNMLRGGTAISGLHLGGTDRRLDSQASFGEYCSADGREVEISVVRVRKAVVRSQKCLNPSADSIPYRNSQKTTVKKRKEG